MARPASNPERAVQLFWSKVKILSANDCWIWTAAIDRYGYGKVYRNKGVKCASAHRVAYMLAHDSDIPCGLNVLHECDNPRCCNPAHLWLGTQADNVADMVRKGRYRNKYMTPFNPIKRRKRPIRKDSGATDGDISTIAISLPRSGVVAP